MSPKESKYFNQRPDSEYYIIYDRKGKYLGTIDRSEEKSLGIDRETVIEAAKRGEKVNPIFLQGVSCFVVNSKGQVLLEVRANTELTPGKVDLVSGHVDGSETPSMAIIRELREEVGIDVRDNTKVRKTNVLSKPLAFKSSSGKARMFFIDFYFYYLPDDELSKIGDFQQEEVQSLKWVDMDQVFEMMRSKKTKFPKANYEEIFENVRNMYLQRKSYEREKEIGE